jgi:sodium transport system permease protein
MRWSLVKTIFLKELRDILRDRRTLFVMVVLPILLYPLLMIGFTQIAALQVSKLEQKKSHVVILGEQFAGSLASALDTISTMTREDTVEWRGRLARNEIEAVLEYSPGFADSVATRRSAQITIYFNSSKEASEQAKRRLEDVFEQYHQRIVAARLEALSADTTLLRAYSIHDENIATQEQQQGAFIGKLLGYIIIIMTLMGAFYPAIDLTAGEKERGTLETLLVSPASRSEIVFGKFLTVAAISLITASLNVLSIGVSMAYIFRQVGGGAGAMSALSVSPWSLVLSYLLILPLAVSFAALCLAIAVSARTYKEGQSLLSPLYTVVILPAMVSLLPGTEISPVLAAIPIVNVSLLIKEYMMGHYLWLETGIAFGSTSVLASLALLWATSQFKQESVIFRHAEDVRWSPFRMKRGLRPTEFPSPGSAILLVMVEIILLFQMNVRGAEWGIPKLLLFTELGVILLPPLWVLYRGRYDLRTVLRLRPPRPSAWPATFLLIAGGWLISLELATLQHHFFPFPEDLLKQFAELFKSLDALSIGSAIFLIAVLPGVCEELLCRGFLLSSFRPRFGNAGAIVLVAILFGLLHMNPYRLLPTMFLGLLLGMIVVYTGSIFPSMFAHAMSNSLSFLAEKHQDWITAHLWTKFAETEFLPWPLLIFGMLLLAAGIYWLSSARAPTTSMTSPEMPAAILSEEEH